VALLHGQETSYQAQLLKSEATPIKGSGVRLRPIGISCRSARYAGRTALENEADGHDAVPACPSTNPVEQPIDLFFNRPAYTTFLRVGIKAWPITPLASSLSNRPQGKITPVALRSGRSSVG
jgi:hypothetical protein